jgi:hypothetical protein
MGGLFNDNKGCLIRVHMHDNLVLNLVCWRAEVLSLCQNSIAVKYSPFGQGSVISRRVCRIGGILSVLSLSDTGLIITNSRIV